MAQTFANWDGTGLEEEVLALITAGLHLSQLYSSSARGGRGTLHANSDMTISSGANATPITAISELSNGSILRFNDNGALNLGSYFAGAGNDLTIHFITDDGSISFPVKGNLSTTGGGYANFNVPSADRLVLRQITSGEVFIFALTRPSAVVITPPPVAPTVRISVSPTETNEGGSLTVTATASDTDGTIQSVTFLRNNVIAETDTSDPYTYIYDSASAGMHTFTATAIDDDGLIGTSNTLTVSVNALPTVSILASSTRVNEGGSVTLTATAADSDGTIASVEFKRNGTIVKTDTSSPYNYSYDSATIGTHSFLAVATDNDGATKTSNTVTVAVKAKLTISLAVSPAEITLGQEVTLTAIVANNDGIITQVVFVEGANQNTYANPVSSTVTHTYTPTETGEVTFSAFATDKIGSFALSEEVTFTVIAPVPDPVVPDPDPVVPDTNPTAPTISNIGIATGVSLSQTLPVGVGGNAPLTYQIISTLPTGFTFNADTRVLSGSSNEGSNTLISYIVVDADNDTALAQFRLIVTIPDTNPTAPTIPDITINAETSLSQILALGTGGNAPLSYALATLPTGFTFDPLTRSLSGSSATASNTLLTYTVTDDDGDFNTSQFRLTVTVPVPDPVVPDPIVPVPKPKPKPVVPEPVPSFEPLCQLQLVAVEDCPVSPITIEKCQLQLVAVEDCPVSPITIEKCQLQLVAVEDCPVEILTLN